MRGRPSKFDPERARKMIELVRCGTPVEAAAAASRIHRATYYRWMERGAKQRSGELRDFYDEVTQAKGEFEARHIMLIAKEAVHNWRASAFLVTHSSSGQLTYRQSLLENFRLLKRNLDPAQYRDLMVALAEQSRPAAGKPSKGDLVVRDVAREELEALRNQSADVVELHAVPRGGVVLLPAKEVEPISEPLPDEENPVEELRRGG